MLSKAQVKYIQSLSQKKQRESEGLFIAEGPKIIRELLNEYPEGIKQVYATKKWINDHRLSNNIELTELEESELERISSLTTPNQVLAVVQQFPVAGNIETKERITLVLDSIQDPGNFGSIIRIADWFGIGQVICNQECADIYNTKVVQATMGSIARVSVLYTDIKQWLIEQDDVKIYGTALKGKPINEVGKIAEGIVIIGNESKGIDDSILKVVHEVITIPKKGKAESLNAAVATGIILSHVCDT